MQITRSKQYGARTHSKESATSPTAKPLTPITNPLNFSQFVMLTTTAQPLTNQGCEKQRTF